MTQKPALDRVDALICMLVILAITQTQFDRTGSALAQCQTETRK